MIKLTTEVNYRDNEMYLRIEYDADKELELIRIIRKAINELIKEVDNNLAWDLADITFDFLFIETTEETKDKLEQKLNLVEEKYPNLKNKVKEIKNNILALLQMKEAWKELKEKFKDKFKIYDLREILYVYM